MTCFESMDPVSTLALGRCVLVGQRSCGILQITPSMLIQDYHVTKCVCWGGCLLMLHAHWYTKSILLLIAFLFRFRGARLFDPTACFCGRRHPCGVTPPTVLHTSCTRVTDTWSSELWTATARQPLRCLCHYEVTEPWNSGVCRFSFLGTSRLE